MLTKMTAGLVWNAYNEIEKGEKLLLEMEKLAKEYVVPPNPTDPFGQRRDLQLGIPSSDSSRTMLNVRPDLAMVIIRAHVAEKKGVLETLNIQAGLEANGRSMA